MGRNYWTVQNCASLLYSIQMMSSWRILTKTSWKIRKEYLTIVVLLTCCLALHHWIIKSNIFKVVLKRPIRVWFKPNGERSLVWEGDCGVSRLFKNWRVCCVFWKKMDYDWVVLLEIMGYGFVWLQLFVVLLEIGNVKF